MFGIRVDAFKIGFGPKIFAWKRGETEYGLNLIPFGGYVKIFGENPDAESILGVDHKRSMIHKAKWKQVVVLAGGVLFNIIFAFILYVGLFTHGVAATNESFSDYSQYFSNPRIMVTDILPGSPAEKAGLKIGDVVLAVNMASSTTFEPRKETVTDVQNVISLSQGKVVDVTYKRAGDIEDLLVAPTSSLVAEKYVIGIAMDNVVDMQLPFFTAIYEGAHYTLNTFQTTTVGLYDFVAQIFQGKADLSQVTGPVGIAGIVGDAARLGFTYLLMITALISINLAVINLIPFPALDGGRILFVIIESITRRPIPPKLANGVNLIGFGLLMLLMIVITYKDIVKLFQ